MKATEAIPLPNDARVFRRFSEWDGMYPAREEMLAKGTMVTLAATARLEYDGVVHRAVKISASELCCGDNYYVIVREAGLSRHVR